jgi:hypothetical protein
LLRGGSSRWKKEPFAVYPITLPANTNAMSFVPEHIIEDCALQIGESPEKAEALLKAMGAAQPALLPFIAGDESESAFTQAEREYLLYLLLVVWNAWDAVHGRQPFISPEALSEAEEKNWELLEATPAKRFRERLDVFFAHSTQEDLLAFLEDMLAEPEEDEGDDTELSVSREGREPMFVLLKSVVDCLEKN